MESTIISVWTPRSFLSRRPWATAFGMPPIPSWIVEPSSTRLAMWLPIASSILSGVVAGSAGGALSVSTKKSTSPTWTCVSPNVRGSWGLTSRITVPAFSRKSRS